MSENTDRLEEIRDEMIELLDEAQGLLGKGLTKDRAEVYWIPHIREALGNDNQFHMCTMQDTIEEMEQNESEEDN